MESPPLRHDGRGVAARAGERGRVLEQGDERIAGARVAVSMQVGSGGMFHGIGAADGAKVSAGGLDQQIARLRAPRKKYLHLFYITKFNATENVRVKVVKRVNQ
jgi:hypothetical protein